ncbi:MAG: hypothetical protein GY832_39570 [Chloroflexi bacterium]|nr:hypothetical protein [Chloroflexota bacterium]
MKMFGERNGGSKLALAEVVMIRERHVAGETRQALAVTLIGRIVTCDGPKLTYPASGLFSSSFPRL